MAFRDSPFIDFNTGIVKIPPMDLIKTLGLRAKQPLPDMLRVFECRVDVWQFGPAAAMLVLMDSERAAGESNWIWRHSGYALLSVTISYFEMIGKILNPDSSSRRSKGDFNAGFCDVYPEFAVANTGGGSERGIPDEFRDRLRNGMCHLGYTKSHLYIHHQPDQLPNDFMVAVQDGEQYYFVNPHTMTRTIIAHFPSLMERLRNTAQQFDPLRESFRRFYLDFHQGEH